MSFRPVALALVPLLFACETDDAEAKAAAARQHAAAAAEKTKAIAADATRAGKSAVDATEQTTRSVIDTGKRAAKLVDTAAKTWAELPGTGELSERARGWLATATDRAAIESVIREGTQIGPVALEIASSVAAAVDQETAIEPIYQRVQHVDGADTDTIDAAIADMPRTEVIDGLTIGFKQLDASSIHGTVKERGYLVVWREGETLVGFVIRSKRTIDVERLVSDAPRLIALARSAIAE